MSFVLPDIIEGNGGRYTIKGWEFSRIFTVEGLTSAGHAMMVEATVALNIPIGSPHPTVPQARAIEFLPESIPTSGNAARVTVLYREFSEDIRIDLGSRVVNRETGKFIYVPSDSSVSPRTYDMTLEYTYPDDYKVDLDLAGTDAEPQGVRLSYKEYEPTIIVTRTEFTSISADALSGHPIGVKLTAEMLTDRQLKFNGFTNRAGWDVRPNDQAHVWQCQISSTSAEDGLAFRVTYAISHDYEKWEYEATFKDPNTGEPVPDPTEDDNVLLDNSRKRFTQYRDQDFNLLEFP